MASEARLRMRDVCARTGLARSTIHHYIREGLLPRPRKTGRNTALYDEGFVRRAMLVRALQERTHMPLAEIRETLDAIPDAVVGEIDVDRFTDITRSVADELRLASEQGVSRSEILARTGLTIAELKGLEAVGLVESSSGKREPLYSPLDVRIVMAFARLREAGIPIGAGYAEVVEAYRRHLPALARAEARAMVGMVRTLAQVDIEEFIKRTADPAGELIAALHRKALVRAIGDLVRNGR